MTTASPAVRHTTTAAVAAVGLIAAIVSYSHMQQLGEHHGEAWRSWLIPISIDGLMAAASMVLLTRRRSGLPASPLAWVALALGAVASLAANMADAQPDLTAILYAGWAPLGFLLAFELLLQQRRAEAASPVAEPASVIDGLRAELAQVRCDLATALARQPESSPAVEVASSPVRQPESHQISPAVRQVASASYTHGEQAKKVTPRPVAPTPRQMDTPLAELVKRARPLLAKEPLGRQALADKLGCTSHQARQVLDHLKTSTKPALHAVATGSR